MLQALDLSGRLIMPVLMNSEQINQLRKRPVFFCPVCGSKVMIRAGEQVIPHFAHYSRDPCPAKSGGEGFYHETGKLLLYKWLKSQKINCQLEPYLSDIAQRPDLLAEINGRHLAIEYQCARTSAIEIRKRMKAFASSGYEQIWILGGNRFRRKNASELVIDRFSQNFIHAFKKTDASVLYYFCPHHMELAIFQSPVFASTVRALGRLRFQKLPLMKFTDLFDFQDTAKNDPLFISCWKKEKRRFRLSSGRTVSGSERSFRQWLYLNRLHIETLPTCIYMPVKSQYIMSVSPWDWQARLCIELLQPLPVHGVLSVDKCMYRLRQFLQDASHFPLMRNEPNPIWEYLQILAEIGLLSEPEPGIFRKERQIDFPQNVEQAIYEDEQLLNQLSQQASF